MAATPIRVLVVDDSAVVREVICDLLAADPAYVVVGTAPDGREALDQIERTSPDVVTLDVQMPGMDGLATLDAILAHRAIPVIMVSSLTQRAASVTLQALEHGAMDYVAKPDHLAQGLSTFRDELLAKIRNMAGADVRRVLEIRAARRNRPANVAPPQPVSPALPSTSTVPRVFERACIAIGISTGGPPALSGLFQTLAPPLPPVVVVQHMPAQFTGPFAARLNAISPLNIKEAAAGDLLEPNHVYVAPGAMHLALRRRGFRVTLDIVDRPPVSGHKPSVDVMFTSAAAAYGNACLAVIMTGMGHDGVEGCREIRAAGGYVLGQDQHTSDVYGMNKVAFTSGHVDTQFPLDDLPDLIRRHCDSLARKNTWRPKPAPTAAR